MFELVIKISNEEKKMTREYPIYEENVRISRDDPVLKGLVEDAVKEFKDEVDRVRLNIHMEW